MPLALICHDTNDLYGLLRSNGVECSRCASAAEAIDDAPQGAGIMILAKDYPETVTPLDGHLFSVAAKKNLRMYVAFPGMLPNLHVGQPRAVRWERAVVSSDAFGLGLPRLRILAIHNCRSVSVASGAAHMITGRVAGFDSAVYGLPETTHPVLFEHPDLDLLVATTKLSQFISARYAPTDGWAIV